MIQNNKKKEQVTIGFRGSEEYRAALQQEALNRSTKVQPMLEKLIHDYLAVGRADGDVSSDQQRYIAALLYGMEHGSKDEKKTIDFALRKFVGRAEIATHKVPITKAG